MRKSSDGSEPLLPASQLSFLSLQKRSDPTGIAEMVEVEGSLKYFNSCLSQ